MQTLRLPESSYQDFLCGLKDFGTVWAPVESEPGIFRLEALGDVDRARPDALRTVIPF